MAINWPPKTCELLWHWPVNFACPLTYVPHLDPHTALLIRCILPFFLPVPRMWFSNAPRHMDGVMSQCVELVMSWRHEKETADLLTNQVCMDGKRYLGDVFIVVARNDKLSISGTFACGSSWSFSGLLDLTPQSDKWATVPTSLNLLPHDFLYLAPLTVGVPCLTIFQYKERASKLAHSLGGLLAEKNQARAETLQRLTKVNMPLSYLLVQAAVSLSQSVIPFSSERFLPWRLGDAKCYCFWYGLGISEH